MYILSINRVLWFTNRGPTSPCLNIIIVMIFISLKCYFLITGTVLFILQGVYFSAVRV